MKQHVVEFNRLVSEAMSDEDGDGVINVQRAIESAYDQCIATRMKKSYFLTQLGKLNEEVFSLTVDHLFTPIHWSRVKLRTLWAIKNTATGNLLTLERKNDEDAFLLKESSEKTDRLDYAPMLTGQEEDANMFIKMMTDALDDAPLGINETLITMNIDERINVVNLEAVEVKVIF